MKTFRILASLIFLCAGLQAKDVPPGFRLQELKATGGSILMPDDWQFDSHGTPTGWLYTFADRFNDDWTYITGFRIQLILDVKNKSGGKTPHQEVLKARDNFKQHASKVLKECDEEDGGLFRKTCLETLEPNPYDPSDQFHVIYSFFWNDETDTMAVSIFGAPESKWANAEKIYKVMQPFTIIDVAKMEKNTAEPSPTPLKIEPGQLVGTWRFDNALGLVDIITHRADGTFTSRIFQNGKIAATSEGTWATSGNIITYIFLHSTIDKLPPGTKDADNTVYDISSDHIDIFSQKLRRYHRVKDE